MATTTPATPDGAEVIYPPSEGQYYPTPKQALANWTAAMAQVPEQAGLL